MERGAGMTERDVEPDERLAELAKKIEEQLNGFADEDCRDLSDSLMGHEVAELERAEQALVFLRQARKNITALAENAEADSTFVSNESTHGDWTGDAFEGSQALPKEFGRFEIIKVLGQGGFARVLLARDPLLDRLVALKIPLPKSLASPATRVRFEREARAAAILSHPAIVPIFESGAVGPISYIAFAYCPGTTLSEWFAQKSRQVSPRSAAEIMACLADAVEHAHQRGIIHRDLKPANILVENREHRPATKPPLDDIAGQVRIADFGLARLESNQDMTITADGAVVGTPAYMSPEQAQGDGEVSAASDIFALGTIFYELLTGVSPFQKSSHLSTLKAIESHEPPSPRELKKDVPEDLAAICQKCINKSPGARYKSAYELAADLQRWQNGVPVVARPVTKMEKVAGWVRRNPAFAAAMLFGFVSLAVGLGVSTWQWQNALANLSLANENSARASRHLENSQIAINEMISQVAGQLKNVPEYSDLRAELIRRAVELQEDILKDESDSPKTNHEMTLFLSRLKALQSELGDHSGSLETSQRAIDIIKENVLDGQRVGEKAIHDEFRINKAKQLHILGQSTEALQLLELVISETTEQARKSDPFAVYLNALAFFHRGKITDSMGQSVEAIELLKQGIGCLAKSQKSVVNDAEGNVSRCPRPECMAGGLDRQMLDCKLHDTLGSYQLKVGDEKEGESNIRKAIAIAQPVVDENPTQSKLADDLAICRLNLANVLENRKDFDSAIEQYRSGWATFNQLRTSIPDHPRYASLCVAISRAMIRTHLNADDAKSAESELGQLKQLISELPPHMRDGTEMRFELTGAYLEIARFSHRNEDLAIARDILGQAIELITQLELQESRPYRVRRHGELLQELAKVSRMEKKLPEAIEQCTEACALLKKSHLDSTEDLTIHPVLVDAFRDLAELHAESGDWALAQEVAKELVGLLPDNDDATTLRDEMIAAE